jgi:hypothetical protein
MRKFCKQTPIPPELRAEIGQLHGTMPNKKLADHFNISINTLMTVIKQEGFGKLIKRKIGEVRVHTYSGIPYNVILTEEGDRLYHRHLWEQERGPIPAGQVLRARDGNQLSTDLDNWELIGRRQNMTRNKNPEKVGQSMKKHWDKVKRWEAMGLKVHFSKHASRRKKTFTKSISTEPNKYITF